MFIYGLYTTSTFFWPNLCTSHYVVFLTDDFGRRQRGRYDGPKIADYDKFCKLDILHNNRT